MSSGKQISNTFTQEEGDIHLGGIDAIVRLTLDQVRTDARRGLKTGMFVSGYRGSPVGMLDAALIKQQKLLVQNHIHFVDGGNALFPSKQALGQPLVEKSLSRIVGRLTEEEFGTRVSLHRIRDNVATEAVEELKNGLAVAAGVLGHRDARTTARHYDRAQGRAAMSTVATLVAERRGQGTRLRV